MPWCPKCKTEYREGFETCADCGEPLIVDEPATSQRRREPSRFAVSANLIWSVVLAAATYVVAFFATLFPHRADPAPTATFIGVLCIGGILFALLQPRPRLWRSLILWAIPPALVVAISLINMVGASESDLRDLFVWDALAGVGYLLAGSGIGAVTATIAGRWFCGQGHKYALALLATVVAFVSTPCVVHWLAIRLYG